MKLLIRADDFGLTPAISEGILYAHQYGLVKSVGIMINCEDSVRAMKRVQEYPDICLGLHVNLVLGKPAYENMLPSLVGTDGLFHSSSYYRTLLKEGKIDQVLTNRAEIAAEVWAQVRLFQKLAGKNPSYIDSHAVSSETLQEVLVQVATALGIVCIQKNGCTNTGVQIGKCPSIYEWYQEERTLEAYLQQIAGRQTEELQMLVLHPGWLDCRIYAISSLTEDRAKDLEFVTSETLKSWIGQQNIQLICHTDLQ